MSRVLQKQMLLAAGADAVGDWFELTQLNRFTAAVNINSSAASLVGALRFRGTNNSPQLATESILANPVAITALPSGITIVAGVVTIASPAAQPFTIVLDFPAFPQFVMADWDFTSGGGTVAVSVQGSGWSVG